MDTARKLAPAIGVAYSLPGIAGFFVTGSPTSPTSPARPARPAILFLGLEVNPLHIVVDRVVGLAGSAMWCR